MRILGFDTATRATTVALCELGGETEIELRDDPPRGRRPRHTTRLLPLIAQALERARLGWEDVDRIAVGTGPGTFTGLRVGVATARAIARARGIPLVGVSTLQSLALGALVAPEHAAGTEIVIPVLDARRRELFAAAWPVQAAGAGSRLGASSLAPCAIAPDALAALITGLQASVLAIGEGAVEFREVLERSGASVPEDGSRLHRVSGVWHCRLAGTVKASAPDQIHPEYLRLPDAEIAHRAAGRP